jgi:hypothetical protein
MDMHHNIKSEQDITSRYAEMRENFEKWADEYVKDLFPHDPTLKESAKLAYLTGLYRAVNEYGQIV